MFGFQRSSAQQQWLIKYILAVKKHPSYVSPQHEWWALLSLGFKRQEELIGTKSVYSSSQHSAVCSKWKTKANFDTGVSEAKLIFVSFSWYWFCCLEKGLKRWHSGLYVEDFDLIYLDSPDSSPDFDFCLKQKKSLKRWYKSQSALCCFGFLEGHK